MTRGDERTVVVGDFHSFSLHDLVAFSRGVSLTLAEVEVVEAERFGQQSTDATDDASQPCR